MESQDNQPEQTPANCGNCKWGMPNPQDMNAVICYGAPPTPILAGARQVGLRQELQFQSIRPILARTEQPCALWLRKVELIVGGIVRN